MLIFIIICSLLLTAALLGYLVPRWQLDPFKSIVGGIVIFSITSLLTVSLFNKHETLGYIQVIYIEFFVVAMLFAGLVLILFSRDPERYIRQEPQGLIAPADGTICYIRRIEKGGIPVSQKGNQHFTLDNFMEKDLKTDVCYQIGIAMSLLDVHVNRAPISGKVLSQKKIHGYFISLKKPRSWFRSARLLTVFNEGDFSVGVVQIASRFVRRIVSYKQPGNVIKQGERFGMIQFGSQVDVILPEQKNMRLCVQTGDKIRAGETVLVKYQDN